MCRTMKHQHGVLEGYLCQSIANKVFHQDNWTDEDTGKAATTACGNRLTAFHYGKLTMLDDVSQLYYDAKPLIEEKICKAHHLEVAAFPTTTSTTTVPTTTNEATSAKEDIAGLVRTLSEGFHKSAESGEKEEKREKREETITKYRLLGATIEEGAHGQTCKLATLTQPFRKFLSRTTVADSNEHLQGGIRNKMKILKEGNDIISFFTDFKPEIINQAFALDVKNCNWHLKTIDRYPISTMDQKLSIIQFTSVDKKHKRFEALLESERTHNLENIQEIDKKEKTKKSRLLYIDGEQTTIPHLHNACCNYLNMLRYMYENATSTMHYKAISRLFNYWRSTDGTEWLEHRLGQNEWFIHSMILELERTRLAYFVAMLSCPDLIATASDTETETEIPVTALKGAEEAADDIWKTVVNSRSGSDGTYRHQPESWNYNNITKPASNSAQQHQQQTGVVQQTGTNHPRPGGGSDNNKNKKLKVTFNENKEDLTPELIEKFQSMGFMECSTKKCPRITHQFSSWDNKELCKGFVMKGRHCVNTKGTCTKAHIPNLAGLPKADQQWLIDFCKKDKACSFVEGKGPKNNCK